MENKLENRKRKSWKIFYRKLLAAAGVSLFLTGCGAAHIRQQSAVDTAMGTIVSQTLYVRQEGEQEETETADIMRILTQLEEQELSWRSADSEVARINALAAGETEEGSVVVSMSPSMREILTQIWQISSDSQGALDVTLGRLSRLWNLDELAAGETEVSIPGQEQIQSAMRDVGYERVRLAEEALELPPGVQLDLGAVGKGIACDRISAYLCDSPQITGAVVAVGGSVVTYGQKPDGSPWKVAIMHPREEGKYLGVLTLTGEHYISTSGDYERYVTVDGVRYHHILDPATGVPARSGLCSVTIVCDSGLQADALSTACFVLGPEQGLALAQSYGAEALLVEENGTVHMTEGMEKIFSPDEQR